MSMDHWSCVFGHGDRIARTVNNRSQASVGVFTKDTAWVPTVTTIAQFINRAHQRRCVAAAEVVVRDRDVGDWTELQIRWANKTRNLSGPISRSAPRTELAVAY